MKTGWIDFHCDTLMRLYDLKSQGKTEETLWENKGHIDLKRLVETGYGAQFFASFLWLEGKPVKGSLYEDALAMADMLHEELGRHPDKAAFAGSYADYIKNTEKGLFSAFLSIEEGDILENSLERLDTLFDRGFRMITLTWNFENCLGYPNIGWKDQDKGLKPFGIEALEKMDELGIIADVSHLSDAGFYDVCRYGKRPFMASHSNARAICGHPRNLTDDMLKCLADNGGITGLNFGGDFLQENGESTLDAMMKHVRHILNTGGREVLCLGTDFDGVEGPLEVSGCHQMPKLCRAMEAAGFTTGEIEDVCCRNAEKFLERYFSGQQA